jgi:hypothetical protein
MKDAIGSRGGTSTGFTKAICRSVALAALLGGSTGAAAQSEVALATRTAKLQALSAKLKKRDENERQQALEWAGRAGIPLRRELPNGRVLELQRLAPGRGPVVYITNNLDAADTVSTDDLWPGGAAGLALTGAGMTVGEWDAGAVAGHPDFYDRLTQVDAAASVSTHSTHVAGTLVGSGEGYPLGGLSPARGMAWEAMLHAYDWNSDTAEMAAAAAAGLLNSNHSYGIAAGWVAIGGAEPDNWWWIGGETSDEDANFGYYDSESQLWDQIAYDAPYYLIVKAAGNDRWDIGPEPGEAYTVVDQSGDPITTSTAPRPGDCGQTGYDCLPTTSVAKNILTVGAVDDVPGGYSPIAGPSQVQMASFSSWGPTDDGRIKPDLVGNGVLVLSTLDFDPFYGESLGTSQAAPNVTGSLVLLQEHYQERHGSGNFMRAATLKALAIHTADETGAAAGPDYEYGWGLLNTEAAAGVISEDGAGQHRIIEGTLENGATDTVQITVSEAGSRLSATLVWADPPATPVAPALDPPDSMLVNDLDLRASGSIYTFLPWVLDPSAPAAPATRGDNVRDNVEQVVIDAAEAGDYSVSVSHKGAFLEGGSQDYALIVSVEPALPATSGLIIDEDFSAGMPAGWSVVTSRGKSWSIRSPLAGDERYDNLTGSSGNFAMVDNNYSDTLTSLRTPVLDLSSTTGAVLRFNSFFYYDQFESINVDVSTDGGGGWSNVWTHSGFSNAPTLQTLNLGASIAGHAAVMLRFRFESGWLGPDGNFWQIDNIELEVFGGTAPPTPGSELPGQSSSPFPVDGATALPVETDLSWAAGANATSHDVYFGTGSPLDAGHLQGNQTGTTFNPGTLAPASTFYWRVDEVNGSGVTRGETWSFSTAAATPAESIHLTGLSGSAIPGSRGRWTAAVEIAVQDQEDAPESGVTVAGSWSGGATGGASCVTAGNGRCTVEKGNLKSQVNGVTFTVEDLAKSGLSYQPADNAIAASIAVDQNDTDRFPSAAADSYQTGVDTPFSGNLLDNDNQGDGPALVYQSTPPASGTLDLDSGGAFTYTPAEGFEGSDSFSYSIVDQDGDISNTATVAIEVGSAEPPPAGGLSVAVRPYKLKGVRHVEVSWQDSGSGLVDIFRGGTPLENPHAGDSGAFVDAIGGKGSGSYTYSVCESGTSDCVEATAVF